MVFVSLPALFPPVLSACSLTPQKPYFPQAPKFFLSLSNKFSIKM
jgi:hypothetical protein